MNELCPRCREVRELEIRRKSITKMDDSGTTVKVTVSSFYCTSCGTFIRSEEAVTGKGM
jgi:predicted RNA-binding Zn-ribbon protein involved in translation (DUF1610 family)